MVRPKRPSAVALAPRGELAAEVRKGSCRHGCSPANWTRVRTGTAACRCCLRRAHDVLTVVADPALVALPDEQILAHAASTGRALVTPRIQDFLAPDSWGGGAGG